MPFAIASRRHSIATLGASSRLVLVLAICLVSSGLTGCRSLRSGRQTRALADARQLSLRGADYLQQGKVGDAETWFTEALRHSPADERAHWGIGEVLWHRQECEQAITHMSRAAEISGASPDLLVRLGQMHLSQGNLTDAIQQADAALASQRDHGEAWALRGKVLKEQGQLSEALNSYHRALQEREHYPEVQVALAEIYYQQGRPQRALATLECLTDNRVGEGLSPAAWFYKGQALAALGQSGEAQQCLRSAAMHATEEDMRLLLKIADAQIRNGDLAEARICLGRAAQHDPNDPDFLRIKQTLDQSFQSISSNTALVGFETPLPAVESEEAEK